MKKKKYQRGGFEQGFRAREDESLGMRTGPERAKLQDMAARRADSYGAWGRRPNQMINRDVGGTAEEIAEAEAKPSVYQPKHKGEGGPNLDATMLLRKGRAIARIEGGDRHEELVEIAEGKWNVEFESLMDNQGSEIDPDLKKRMRSMQEGFNANFLGGVQNTGTATVIEGHDSASSLGETDKARGMGAAVKGTGFKGVF